ncbi:glycosyltransferase [candidate division WWE3 bacterium]|nr:glycosyltransferase [candidate division WWE3 bacterium]
MKLAIVCDDLIQFGGQERLVLAAHGIWPKAPVYASVASKRWLTAAKSKGIDLRLSFMQKLPLVEELNRIYAAFFMHILAFESFDFSSYDIVLSFSSRFAHGVITKPETKHICYMNSPGRMFWEPNDYFKKERVGCADLSILLNKMRIWSYTAAQRVEFLVSNSDSTRRKVKKYFGRDSVVIYPFAEADWADKSRGDYFLIVTRLLPWKRVDIAVEAANKCGVKVKIVGAGPDLLRLKKIAGPTVEFLGELKDNDKCRLMSGCIALVSTQAEDFGIAPIEAMALGRPVIAYGEGGVLETVVEGKTGEFFYEQTAYSLAKAVENFDPSKYSAHACISQARKFSKDLFERNLKQLVHDVYLGTHYEYV